MKKCADLKCVADAMPGSDYCYLCSGQPVTPGPVEAERVNEAFEKWWGTGEPVEHLSSKKQAARKIWQAACAMQREKDAAGQSGQEAEWPSEGHLKKAFCDHPGDNWHDWLHAYRWLSTFRNAKQQEARYEKIECPYERCDRGQIKYKDGGDRPCTHCKGSGFLYRLLPEQAGEPQP